MRIDPQQLGAADLYRFMIGAIVPRPIAWVSTRGGSGTNLAPFSYFTAISSDPPLVGFSIFEREGDPKDTLRNLRETGDWVVNVVSEPLLEAMVTSAGDWPRGVSEFEMAGLAEVASERVSAPGVARAAIRLECRLVREVPLGANVFVIGEIVLAHADDAVMVDGRVDPERLAPIGRLGGELFAPLREVRKVPRPRVSRTTGEPKA